MKPYCSVKDFPFNYSPAIQFFTTGFLISTMEVGGITAWKPAAVRAVSNHFPVRAVARIRVFDESSTSGLVGSAHSNVKGDCGASSANELLVYLTDVLCSCPRSTRGSALKPPTLTL